MGVPLLSARHLTAPSKPDQGEVAFIRPAAAAAAAAAAEQNRTEQNIAEQNR